jgi:hypothetical protein
METINTKMAAKIIGVDKRTLDNWRSAGRGPAYIKISKRKINYLRDDVETFIQKKRIEPVNN